MDTTFDILQAIGLGLAFGLRPVLAPLVVAICAAANFAIDFTGTSLDFLESTPALVVLGVVAVAGIVEAAQSAQGNGLIGPRGWLLIAAVFGGLFGAGSVADHADVWWYGAVLGVVAAALGWAATHPLVTGARTRLAGEPEARLILPAVVELTAVVTAVLSLVVPPLAVIALIAAVVLVVRGRGSAGERYAGLRTLSK